MFGNIAEVPTYTQRNIIGDRMQYYEKDVKTLDKFSDWRSKHEPKAKQFKFAESTGDTGGTGDHPSRGYDKCM